MLWLVLAHLLRAQPDTVTGATMTSTEIVTEPPLTRDELLESLTNMNARAKKISRRGFVGLMSDEYERRHADIDRIVTQIVGH